MVSFFREDKKRNRDVVDVADVADVPLLLGLEADISNGLLVLPGDEGIFDVVFLAKRGEPILRLPWKALSLDLCSSIELCRLSFSLHFLKSTSLSSSTMRWAASAETQRNTQTRFFPIALESTITFRSNNPAFLMNVLMKEATSLRDIQLGIFRMYAKHSKSLHKGSGDIAEGEDFDGCLKDCVSRTSFVKLEYDLKYSLVPERINLPFK
mmetsp:Transcript_25971/g.60969  ORF Transcript_25971/g.60969 Transcript_25971/m.60969 type:complete len:210 (+) Transcript_25971:1243-1872(+)